MIATPAETLRHAVAARGAFPLALALIAGAVDVTTFVLLDGLFSAHVTGNLVSLAAGLALHRPLELTSVLSLPVFVLVTALLTVLVDSSPTAPWTWTQRLLCVQLVLVLAAGATSVLTNPQRGTSDGILVGLLAVAAMAAQNALLHLTFRKAPTTAVMTGNLVAATVALATLAVRGRADRQDLQAWRSTWPLIAGFFLGCLAGALFCGVLGRWGWTLPVGLCATVTAISLLVQPPAEISSRPRHDRN